jgi:hypothetical protein
VTATATAVIAAPALVAQGTPITATAGELFEGRVATFTDSTPGNIASDYTASINWGTSTTQGSIVAIGPGAYEVRGQFTFTGAGSFPVAVTITRQGGGASATANSTATVSATFTATSIGAISASAGVPFTGVVARVNDGQTGSQATGLSAVIDWGDGQTSAGSISAPAGGVFSVVGTHTYAAPGSYQVRTTVTRASDGATVESVLQANVFVFSGGLDPLSAAGVVGGASITFQDQPILSGVAPPGSTINLFLRRPNGGDPLPLADTIADSTGRWSLIVGPLDAKKFLLYGVAVPTNSPASPIALLNGGIPIRVLAHPIRVQAHSVIARGNRVTARILAADFAGETEAELGTAAYRLIDRQGREWAPTVVKLARPVGKRGAQSATVTLLFSRGLTLQRGRFDLRVAMDGLADKEGKAVEDLRVRVRKG